MSTIQAVTEKMTELTKLALGFVAHAASNLVGSAEKLSLEEIERRFDGALRALRGDKEPTAQKTSLEIAEEMVASYEFNQSTGVSTFTVPAGVTDVDAMRALNEYFRKNHPAFYRDAVYVGRLERIEKFPYYCESRDSSQARQITIMEWFEKLPKRFPDYCETRDYSQARQITILGVVTGTIEESRYTTEGVLKGKSLVFSDPRDQALAAAIHACKHEGADLFKRLWVRGSVPGFALRTTRFEGVIVKIGIGVYSSNGVAASGSPSPE